jgi:O-antigen biosynthesis protein
MHKSIKRIDIELSQPIQSITNLTGYTQVSGLIRFRQRPLGWVEIPIQAGTCSRETIAQRIFPCYSGILQRELVQDYLLQPGTKTWQIQDLLTVVPAPVPQTTLLTVAYCCNDRAGVDLVAQLEAIRALEYPHLEVLVVEALPIDPQLQQLVVQQFPQFHYHSVVESGLNAARNWAIDQAQGEYIAFLDPQASPEPQWASSIVSTFATHPQVAIIAGLTMPHCLQHQRQVQFAYYYALLERGFEPRHHHWHGIPQWNDLDMGKIGSGSNLACRRSVFNLVGRFDPALDLPGYTIGGGDWEWFLRALASGATVRYEPRMMTDWHIPSSDAAMQQQAAAQRRAFYSAIQSGIARYPQYRMKFMTLALWRLALSLMRLVRTYGIPRSWSWAELQAALQSWGSYAAGLRYIAALPPSPAAIALSPPPLKQMAVRTIDLDAPLPHFDDITDYAHLRVFLQQANQIRGKVDLHHQGAPVSREWLARTIAEQWRWPLLAEAYDGDIPRAQQDIDQQLRDFWLPPIAPAPVRHGDRPTASPIAIPDAISIIIPTCDRPQDLTNCLTYLCNQTTDRTIEIIVADNRPQSGLTPPVVAQFPGVCYVAEPRAGASYARNRAIAASHHEIIVMIDDDVTIPPDWLEKLLAPFARPEIAAVTGNVLPIELDSPAQWMCEDLKGGLSAGWERFEVDQAWLESFEYAPPIWELGVSANAAFRASLFADPRVGLMNEILGPGTPCGAGEELYLFYKILRAGYTLTYEPSAHVWHRHRQTMTALRKQQQHYMRSASACQLLVWQQDGDRRALQQMLKDMPIYLCQYVWKRLKGENKIPWSIVGSEFYGYYIGFWAYYQSKRRVKRLGRSAPYIPPADRPIPDPGPSHTNDSAAPDASVLRSS